MKVGKLALALAGLCVPGIALAQGSSTSGTMTTTPGVSCTSGALAECTLIRPSDETGTLGTGGTTGSGALGNTIPGATGGSSLGGNNPTSGGIGTLDNTRPGATGGSSLDAAGAAGTLPNTTPGATGGSTTGTDTTGTTGTTGGSSGTLVPTTPSGSLGGGSSSGGL